MQGSLHIITPQTMRQVRRLTGPPALEELQAIVGGDIERVPGFTVVEFFGETGPCVAFVRGQQGTQGLPKNDLATACWQFALTHDGHPGLFSKPAGEDGVEIALVGNVAVVFGDEELLGAL
jgi:hypothetical protein